MNKTTFRKIHKDIVNALLRTDDSEDIVRFMDALKTLHDIPIDVPKPRTKKPAPAPAPAPATTGEVYGVLLRNMGGNMVRVIKSIRDFTQYGLYASRMCAERNCELIRAGVNHVPWTSSKEEAERFVTALVAAGANAEIVPLSV